MAALTKYETVLVNDIIFAFDGLTRDQKKEMGLPRAFYDNLPWGTVKTGAMSNEIKRMLQSLRLVQMYGVALVAESAEGDLVDFSSAGISGIAYDLWQKVQ